MSDERHYRVIIEDELTAESPWHALRETVERIKTEETVASVECLSTGEILHYEITTGARLDEEGL
jgi:hypothetical protein